MLIKYSYIIMSIIFNQTTATIKILRLVRYFFQIIKKYLTNFLLTLKHLKKNIQISTVKYSQIYNLSKPQNKDKRAKINKYKYKLKEII